MADLEYVDTHCHIQISDYEVDPQLAYEAAHDAGVTRILCVGCTLEDSKQAIAFASQHDGVWATIGLHPHEAKEYIENDIARQEFHALASKPKVVAIGEIGLDYYYNHSDHTEQKEMLRFQLTIAQEHNLPVIFHVRDGKGVDPLSKTSVWHDFWEIYDEFKLPGVIHSFSASTIELEQILARGLFVGLNGIMTFTKDEAQLDAARAVPLDRLLLETDAPYLTPTPSRGTICQPKHVVTTAEFLSTLRDIPLETLARATTLSAIKLFNLSKTL